ncbi:MAG: hypothetical protein AMS26_17250 [Bacteroides sp. SM23_62]|nr:MAG: hypothetical protein AMS26_17250 [Bacteroides sp. SM23_62]
MMLDQYANRLIIWGIFPIAWVVCKRLIADMKILVSNAEADKRPTRNDWSPYVVTYAVKGITPYLAISDFAVRLQKMFH